MATSREERLLGERCRSRDPLRTSGWDDAEWGSLEMEGVIADTVFEQGGLNQVDVCVDIWH